MLKTGVYLIGNTVTKEFYIGSSAIDIQERFYNHLYKLKTKQHRNYRLQKLYNVHGEGTFLLFPLEYTNPANCILCEQKWMDMLNPDLNINPIAGSWLGRHHTPEAKRKIALSHRRENLSLLTRTRMSLARKGKRLPGSICTKISQTLKGRKKSLSTRKKMSERMKHMTGSKNYGSRPVKCLELNKVFESSEQAAEYLRSFYNAKARRIHIGACARHARRSAYGFTWEFIS